MAEIEFIPSLWAGAVLNALQKKTVFESLCNKDYAGEIKKGNTLKIATVDNPTVKDYTKGGDIEYEEIEGTDQSLIIDQQKYFAFKVDDITAVQSNIGLLEAATSGAGFALADSLDTFLADLIKTDGTTKTVNAGATADSGLELISEIAAILDKAKAPDGGRWFAMPIDLSKMVMLDIAGKLTNNTGIITSGYMGSVFGVNLYKSANLTVPLYGHVSAVTVASQIDKTEAVRLSNTFANGIRGLHVYGAKVTRPTLCGKVTIPAKNNP